MRTVTIAEATTELTELLAELESGREDEIVIARDGKAVARMLPSAGAIPGKQRVILGILEGKVKLPEGWEEDFKAQRKEIEDLVYDSALEDSGDQTYVLDPAKIKKPE